MSDCNTRIIAPSILASDWSRAADEVLRAEKAGADWFHLDVMDGHFVGVITFGPQFVEALRPHTGLPFDVHLMIERPDLFYRQFAEAGADRITVHAEANHDVSRTLSEIRGMGCSCGLAISPDTDFSAAEPFLDQIDLLLIMTVRPGYGGQAFMEKETMPKVAAGRKEREARQLNYHIEVDGGIDLETVGIAAKNGANVMVAGTSIFKAEEISAAITGMRE